MSVYLDTSALAKWYLNEPGSEEFEAYLRDADDPLISSLTVTELRSLLARHRRMRNIDDAVERRVFSQFLRDVEEGFVRVARLRHENASAAAHLIGRLDDHPLGTLDALHLAACAETGARVLATADATMAEAARALEIAVDWFG